ncbi:MAG: autotransporter domain-containing protein [Candidatus Accumulibacter sp.]|jgi:hypothetical protein|nr:autotransporter domain-containing protein [Accumulibacter sp.]
MENVLKTTACHSSHQSTRAEGGIRPSGDSPGFAVSILACLIAALCATPALAEERTYGGNTADLQNPPAVPGFTGNDNTFAPTDYLTGNPNGNHINIDYSGGTTPRYVLGGYSDSSSVTGNEVKLIRGAVNNGAVFGGYSNGSGNATGNAVTMSSDANVIGGVTGGYINGSGNATNNTVNISGGSAGTSGTGNVTGGYSNGNGNATGNTVSMSGGIVYSNVAGGYSDGGNATSNTVTMSSDATVGSSVYGGYSNGYGNATNSTVNISGGIVGSGVTGGFSNAGNATDNIVNISGGAIGGNVTGGSSNNGNVTGNTVNISGGTIGGNIVGGHSGNGTVTGNIVNISGGTIGGNIIGGYSYAGNATNNKLIISGTADITGVTALYGGDGGGADKRTGNTLHIDHWQGNGSTGNRSTGANIANFENYRFTLPVGTLGNGQAALTTSGSVDLGNDANVSVAFTGAPAAALRVGQQALLISTSNPMSGNVSGTSLSRSTLGATDYTFDIALENGDTALVATLTGKEINQNKAGVYLYGASARLAALTQGADHMVSLLDNWQHSSQTPTSDGFRSFASLQGGSIKTRTGSSVDNKGTSFAFGGAIDTATRLGTLTTGVFAEGGIGRYDSQSRFGWGDGDTWHYGIGAFARHAFTNRVYLEGSARIGRAKADFDGKGPVSDLHYSSAGNYRGAHAGVGIDTPLNTVSSMDTYAKVLMTRQDADTMTTRAKERLFFDRTNSLRSRIGTRYRHRVDQNLRAHIGVGWEYEFDGKARAKLDGTRIARETETRGHSALIEAGVEWTATKGWSVNANAMALGGQRKGIAGYAQAIYRF